jgi:hypothetical protein
MLRAVTFLTLSMLALISTGSVSHAQRGASNPAQSATEGPKVKVLAEGAHSAMTHPFVAVLRDSETYAELAKLDRNLPQLDPEFFKSNIVVAAFLGERNTGGYSVEIKREVSLSWEMKPGPKGYLRIIERSPGKGVMVPEMITSPFRVVSLEVNPTTNLLLALDNVWLQTMRPYRVTAGTFTVSGGFAGTSDQFGLGGHLRIMRERNLATFAFFVVGLRPQKTALSLADFATGVVNTDGEVTINMMSADSFVNQPNGGLKATGNLSAAGGKIALSFNSLPSMIADGYTGRGIIEAVVVDSAVNP